MASLKQNTVDDKNLAYFKYSGESIKEGYFDLRKSATALNGIDEIIRYHLTTMNSDLAEIDFELPVQIKKGSWVALIPENIGDWIQLIIGMGATTYSSAALKKMAKNDFEKIGFKTVFKQIIKSIKWCIKLSEHIGTTDKKEFFNTTFKQKNGIDYVGVRNDKGIILFIPKKYFEDYVNLPPKLFSKIVEPIEEQRELFIDFLENEKNDKDDTSEININVDTKSIFYSNKEDENDILFPELKHGQFIKLEGHLTRGNEKSNTVGFLYSDHILTCYPKNGNISKDKNKLFVQCRIEGYVDREDKKGSYIEKRPRIKYSRLVPLENNNQTDLFK